MVCDVLVCGWVVVGIDLPGNCLQQGRFIASGVFLLGYLHLGDDGR